MPSWYEKMRLVLDETSKVTGPRGETPFHKIGVVVVGRGSLYSRQPGEELAALADHLRSLDAGWVVAEALMEQGGPSVPDALEACSQAGVGKVIVLPAFMPAETAMRNWLGFVARRWQERTDTSAQVAITAPLAAQAQVADAAVELVRETALSEAPLASAGHKPGTPEPDWSVIPPHNHHVLFCNGPRCAASGAAELGAFFRNCLKDAGLDVGPRHVLAARTGCLYPCNLGPVMVVYPERIWYCGLDESVLTQIIEQHFQKGEAVSTHAFRPSAVPQSFPPSVTPIPKPCGSWK